MLRSDQIEVLRKIGGGDAPTTDDSDLLCELIGDICDCFFDFADHDVACYGGDEGCSCGYDKAYGYIMQILDAVNS